MLNFGPIRHPRTGDDLFFRERWFLGQKAIQVQRRTVFRVAGFGAFGLAPPCSEIVPAPLPLSTSLSNNNSSSFYITWFMLPLTSFSVYMHALFVENHKSVSKKKYQKSIKK